MFLTLYPLFCVSPLSIDAQMDGKVQSGFIYPRETIPPPLHERLFRAITPFSADAAPFFCGDVLVAEKAARRERQGGWIVFAVSWAALDQGGELLGGGGDLEQLRGQRRVGGDLLGHAAGSCLVGQQPDHLRVVAVLGLEGAAG